MKNTTWLTTLFIATLVCVAPTMAFDFNTVIVGGRPAGDPLGPQINGTADWASYINPEAWYINAAGQVALSHTIDDSVPDESEKGIWRWTNGSKQLIARTDSPLPGLPTGVKVAYLSEDGISINASGSMLFKPYLTGTDVTQLNDTAFAIASPTGGVSVPIREGDPAPAAATIGGGKTLNFTNNPLLVHTAANPLLSDDGKMLFATNLTGIGVNVGNDRIEYFGTPDNLQVLVREGSQAPSLPDGVLIGNNITQAYTNQAGYQVFAAHNSEMSPVRSILYRHKDSVYNVIATEQTPTGVAGVNFTPFSPGFLVPQANAVGDVTFSATYDSNAVMRGLYKAPASGGPLQLLAGQGVPAPGTTALFGLGPFSPSANSSHILNNSGAVAFLAGLSGDDLLASNDSGIWINDASGTTLALREGDAANGLQNVTIGAIRSFTFNDSGNLVVVTDLMGDVVSENDTAMWLIGAAGDTSLLLREGDLFDVDPSAGTDNRTIQDLYLGGYTPTDYARFGAFNDANQLAFGLAFTDGHSGIFLTNVAVPEPVSAILVGLAACGCAFSYRRRK